MEQPVKLTFKEQWEQRKLLKRSKKKAKKELQKRGYNAASASSMVKKALKNIAKRAEETPQ
jgi:hypothetical protein